MSLERTLSQLYRETRQLGERIGRLEARANTALHARTGSQTQIVNGEIATSANQVLLVPQSGTADNLDTILNPVDGKIVVLRSGSSDYTITVKHNTGNILLANGDVQLNTLDAKLVLIFNGSTDYWEEMFIGGGGGGGSLSVHDLSGGWHTGTLADFQAPQFLKTNGSRALTGNLSVNSGVTIDGVDISAHAANPAAHHAPVTQGDGIFLAGQQVSVDNTVVRTSRVLTAGNGMTGGGTLADDRTFHVGAGTLISVTSDAVHVANGAAYQFIGTGNGTTPGWRNVAELAGGGLTSANGVLDVAVTHTGAIGLSVEPNAVRLTSSSNPGASAKILASSPKGDLQLITLASDVTFASGFAGSGYRVDYGITEIDKSSAEFDNLTVRGRMRVYELLIQQIRATNGSVFVSSTSESANILADNNWTVNGEQLTFNGKNATFAQNMYRIRTRSKETDANNNDERDLYHGFLDNDVIRAQRFRMDANGGFASVRQTNLIVSRVTNLWEYYAAKVSGDEPEVGDDFVRLGSRSDTTRQGSIYLTADDSNAPFIDIINGITSHADWNTPGKIRVRLGRLSGITDANPALGTLEGYGLYSDNVYLKGRIIVTGGANGGDAIGYDPAQQRTVIDGTSITTGAIRSNNWSTTNGSEFDLLSGTFRLGGSEAPKLSWDGSNLSIVGSITLTQPVPSGSVSGLGALATQSNVAWGSQVTGRPAELTDGRIPAGLNASGAVISRVLPGAAAAPTGAGLYLGSDYLGFHDNLTWRSYMNNQGHFYLGNGSGNALAWDGSNLSIVGSITLTQPVPSNSVSGLGALATQSNVAWGSQVTGRPAELTDGRISAALNAGGTVISRVLPGSAASPSGAGLYLGSDYLGFYNGSAWRSYMDNNGRFYLASGSGNALAWNGSTLSITGDITVTGGNAATQSYVGTTVSNATLARTQHKLVAVYGTFNANPANPNQVTWTGLTLVNGNGGTLALPNSSYSYDRATFNGTVYFYVDSVLNATALSTTTNTASLPSALGDLGAIVAVGTFVEGRIPQIQVVANRTYITGSGIVTNSIVADNIAANTITGDKINASSFLAIGPATTWQSDGIQLQHNSGNPRAYIGNGVVGAGARFFMFDGANISWQAGNTSLGADGSFSSTAATISGTITASGGSITGNLTVGGILRSGKTGYTDNTNTGWWLGVDNGVAKFHIGGTVNSVNRFMRWTGEALEINSAVVSSPTLTSTWTNATYNPSSAWGTHSGGHALRWVRMGEFVFVTGWVATTSQTLSAETATITKTLPVPDGPQFIFVRNNIPAVNDGGAAAGGYGDIVEIKNVGGAGHMTLQVNNPPNTVSAQNIIINGWYKA